MAPFPEGSSSLDLYPSITCWNWDPSRGSTKGALWRVMRAMVLPPPPASVPMCTHSGSSARTCVVQAVCMLMCRDGWIGFSRPSLSLFRAYLSLYSLSGILLGPYIRASLAFSSDPISRASLAFCSDPILEPIWASIEPLWHLAQTLFSEPIWASIEPFWHFAQTLFTHPYSRAYVR